VHRNQHSVEIDRPPGDVFPYLVESDKRLRWMGALRESEQLTPGPPELGARFRDLFEERGQRIAVEAEVVAWEPPARLSLGLRGGMFRATGLQELEDLGGRTRLTTTIDTEYTSRMIRMMAGVVTRHAQARLEADMARLKELLEQAS
jgi:uncharacterized protein YndB with AHSA1/START domain